MLPAEAASPTQAGASGPRYLIQFPWWNVKEITYQLFLESGILILSLEIGLESQYLTFYKGWELWVFGFSVCAQQIAIKSFE